MVTSWRRCRRWRRGWGSIIPRSPGRHRGWSRRSGRGGSGGRGIFRLPDIDIALGGTTVNVMGYGISRSVTVGEDTVYRETACLQSCLKREIIVRPGIDHSIGTGAVEILPIIGREAPYLPGDRRESGLKKKGTFPPDGGGGIGTPSIAVVTINRRRPHDIRADGESGG